MKKISTIFAFVVAMMAFSTNIHAQGMDPQAMIQRQVDRMTSELRLSKDQVAKIEPLIDAHMNKMMELRQQGMEREEMKTFNFDSLETIQQNGNAIELCGPQTGHSVVTIAFCENSAVTAQILDALLLWKEIRLKSIAQST